MQYPKLVSISGNEFLTNVALVDTESMHTDFTKAIANKDRLAILHYLLKSCPNEFTSEELASDLGMNANSARFHLKILRNAGIIDAKKKEVRENLAAWVYKAKYAGFFIGFDPKTWSKNPGHKVNGNPLMPKGFVYKQD